MRALLSELDKQNRLGKFFTNIGTAQGSRLIPMLFGNRRHYSITSQQLNTHFFPEIIRLLSFGRKSQEVKRAEVDRVYQSMDIRVSGSLSDLQNEIDFIHAYEDGALNSFARAKELGIFRSYELPIAHWTTARLLLAQEAERFPSWEPTLESTREPEEKLVRKEQELALANCITCPSKFVLESIPEKIRQNTPCQIAPFGSTFSDQVFHPKKVGRSNKLKLLFVGSMSQRKGLADLFEAMKLVNSAHVSLSILGTPSLPMSFYKKAYSHFEYFSPRSSKGVRRVMQEHHVLVLPSIIEGRALVQQEALACGLPLIVTRNAGGEDLIEEERTGFLVSIRKPEEIAERIDWFSRNLRKIDEMSEYCHKKAKEYQWSEYANSIINFCLRIRSESIDNRS